MSSTSVSLHPRLLPALPTIQPPTLKRTQHVKKRNVSSPVPKLPEGYAFIPPCVPLSYPPTYHLIDAGSMHEAPKIKRKRTVFGALTNIAGRVNVLAAKRDGPSGCGRNADGEDDNGDGDGVWFHIRAGSSSTGRWGVWWRGGFAGRPPPHLWDRFMTALARWPGHVGRWDDGEVGSLSRLRIGRWIRGSGVDHVGPRKAPWDARYLVVVHGLTVTVIWRKLTKRARSLQFL
ncbi:hypothetical protein K438DRAFT_1752410 [Mycena galopus ATCC 62051]|nr:hypothetical protein K438DRAFT_1752410 [Mycena galopus ATCC 62051]